MNFVDKIIRCWYYTKLIFKDEPVRGWRKLPNGQYICDGDCGVYSLHGVCTCGLCHYFQPEAFKKINRSRKSWKREYDTQNTMLHVSFTHQCPHGTDLENDCTQCQAELEIFLEEADS